ncbi:MAG TPA: hypothetical protein VGI43_11045 [Mucilaginibacter sp.]|jgi:hypothetical protein
MIEINIRTHVSLRVVVRPSNHAGKGLCARASFRLTPGKLGFSMTTLVLAMTILLFPSCKSSINPDNLYGKWKYIKVANPNAIPPDSVASDELALQAPYIQFTKSDSLIIIWGGKVLSHGKFRIDGQNIRYTETLADGKTREFPFWVSKLTDKEIIFETTTQDKSRVTAVKE